MRLRKISRWIWAVALTSGCVSPLAPTHAQSQPIVASPGLVSTPSLANTWPWPCASTWADPRNCRK